MPTAEECKRIISRMGLKFGVSPRLISERLLSKEDKKDMMKGDLPIESLEIAVKLWKEQKMPNYAKTHASR